jgi:hypothetical protein
MRLLIFVQRRYCQYQQENHSLNSQVCSHTAERTKRTVRLELCHGLKIETLYITTAFPITSRIFGGRFMQYSSQPRHHLPINSCLIQIAKPSDTLTCINYKTIKETVSLEVPSCAILPTSASWEVGRRELSNVAHHPDFRKSTQAGFPNLRLTSAAGIREYIKAEDQFLEYLMILVYVTGGPSSRRHELLSL